MFSRAITLPDGATLPLPNGLAVVLVRDSRQAAAVRAAIRRAIAAETGLAEATGALWEIGMTDAAIGLHPDPAIRQAHWSALWRLLPSGEPGTDEKQLTERIAQLQRELAGADGGPPTAEQVATREALEHQRQRIEGEISREMRGMVEVPDAARQVARLGETQAEVRREFLALQEQVRDLQAKRESAEGESRKLRNEESRKSILGAVFMVLGLMSTMAGSVPAHLRPLGWVVVILGALFIVQALNSAKSKVSPKEQNLRRQLKDLEARLSEVDARMKEADRQVRQFCARVGCTSPGQVLELQRRYEQRMADLAAIESELAALDQLSPAEDREEGRGAAIVARTPPQVRQRELEALQLELQRRRAQAGRLERPVGSEVVRAANQLLAESGSAVRWRVLGPEGAEPASEESLTTADQIRLYLAARVGLIRLTGEFGGNLPVTLDDPLKLWDDAELADGWPLVSALATPHGPVVVLSTRAVLLDAWRRASQRRGQVLTVLELGQPPA